MDFADMTDKYVKYCLLYPQLTAEQVFNRYMHTIPKEDAMSIGEKAIVMIHAGEIARGSSKKIKDLIMEGVSGYNG